MPTTPEHTHATEMTILNARHVAMKAIKLLTLAGVALSLCATASAAQLTGTLGQMVARSEAHDPSLSALLKFHLTNRAGDPVVMIRLADGVTASGASERATLCRSEEHT